MLRNLLRASHDYKVWRAKRIASYRIGNGNAQQFVEVLRER